MGQSQRKPFAFLRSRLLKAIVAAVPLVAMTGCKSLLFDPLGEAGRWKPGSYRLPINETLGPDDVVFSPYPSAKDPTPEDVTATFVDYKIGRNDYLAVTVSDIFQPGAETTRQLRVTESGKIPLLLIDNPIQAEGLTERELTAAVQKAYRDAKIVDKATVSISVLESQNRTFEIYGPVRSPGRYRIERADFRIDSALLLAGDVDPSTDYVYIFRTISPSDQAATPATLEGDVKPFTPTDTRPRPDDLDPLKPASFRPMGAKAAQQRILNLNVADGGNAGPASAPAVPGIGSEDQGREATIDGRPRMMNEPQTIPSTIPATGPIVVEGFPLTPGGATKPFEFKGAPEPTVRIIRVPVAQLLQGNDAVNVVIRPGDRIRVPAPVSGEYYMGGPGISGIGVYTINNRKITLKMAVISARSLTQVADPTRVEIIRRISDKEELWTSINLQQIFTGEAPDIYLRPNDIVNVGTNIYQPFLSVIRGSFRFTYGFGFLYDRNFGPRNSN